MNIKHWTFWLPIFLNRISVIQVSGIWIIIHKTPSSCLKIMIIMTLWRGVFCSLIFSFQFSPITTLHISRNITLQWYDFYQSFHHNALHFVHFCFSFLYQVHTMSIYFKINDKKRLNSTCTYFWAIVRCAAKNLVKHIKIMHSQRRIIFEPVVVIVVEVWGLAEWWWWNKSTFG